MLSRNYSLHNKNLESYMKFASNISGWEVHEIGNASIVFNGCKDSLFNYVFCDESTSEQNVKEVLLFLKDKGWEMTWAVEPSASKLRYILESNKIYRVSNPKKAYLDIDRFHFVNDDKLNLKFNIVKDEASILQFDKSTSEVFYHKEGIVSLFLRGLKDRDEDNLKCFVVTLNDQIVSVCSMFIDGDNVGFYADGVYKDFRNKRIGSHMVAKRIQIAKEHGCKSVIAHCMSQSINMYERLGFRMMSTLYLYVSTP